MRSLFVVLAACAMSACATAAESPRVNSDGMKAHQEFVQACFGSIESVSPYSTKIPERDGISGGISAGLEEMMSIRAHSAYRAERPRTEDEFRAYVLEQAGYAGRGASDIRYEQYGSPAYALTVAVIPAGKHDTQRQHAQVVRNGQPCGVVEVHRR